MARPGPLRLILCDDHQIVREGLRALLGAEPDMQIVAEAAEEQELFARCAAHAPDVVVMDLALRGGSGIMATARLLRAWPHLLIIVLSMYDDAATVDQALRAGARGYVVKGRGLMTLVEAIRVVARGEIYLSPEVAGCVLSSFAGADRDSLSQRECEVLALLAEGLKGPQIAARLGLSAKTVENHRARIMEKLGIHSTAGLVRYALRTGLSR
jgi:DNA-binding NarL/FixJ family response regulator